LVVGVVFAMGGALVVLELLFVARRVPLLWLFGAGFVATIGGYLVWETLRDWRKS
jgi:hypothetical protein